MSLLSFVFPRLVLRTSSPHNRDIRVLFEQGHYKLLVNGSRQSGEYIKELWQHALSEFGILPSPDVKRILILGVAGGTVIHLLSRIYPHASIDAVDIDGTMIEIGKKYFGLDTVGNLRIVRADAGQFVAETAKQWDLIVIDLYIGASIPPFVADPKFLSRVRSGLSPHGQTLINYLYEFEYRKLSDLFFQKLTEIFSSARDTKIYNNRFFCVVK